MLNYPLAISFRRFTRGRKIDILDASQQTVLQVRSRLLALKAIVDIYGATNGRTPLYQIRADQATGAAEAYTILDSSESALGYVTRHGMKSRWRSAWDTVQDVRQVGLNFRRITSIWNVTYTILDSERQEVGRILEEMPLLKIVGWVLEEFIPARPFLNPGYRITHCGRPALYTRKQPAILNRTFIVQKQGDFPPAAESLLLSSLVIALMIERKRGV
jgi:hypothetical protein